MPQYTVRVYGIWINDHGDILLSDERIGKKQFTKFPGGGMEENEGPIDCLKREWQEELNVDIKILSHFYTTDFFQKAVFYDNTQLLSLYYLVRPEQPSSIKTTTIKNNFSYTNEREEHVRWIPIKSLTEEDVTFPIDKHVVRLIQKEKAHK